MTGVLGPRVALVTVTFNSADVLPAFLASYKMLEAAKTYLIVVDNASSDHSAQLVTDAAVGRTDIELIAHHSNDGVAEGNNIGIRRAQALGFDWVLLINNDVEFGPHLVTSLTTAAATSGFRVMAPLIEGDTPPGSTWYAGGALRPWQGFRATHVAGEEAPAHFWRSEDEVVPTQYASTCCLLVASEVFDTAGVMDASYFVYFDDVDFCIRAQRAGYEYGLTRQALLLHKAGSVTGKGRSDFTARWGVRNWVLVTRRHARNPLQLLVSLLYIQAHVIAGSVVARDSMRRFMLRQRAYFEGIRLDTSDHRVPRR